MHTIPSFSVFSILNTLSSSPCLITKEVYCSSLFHIFLFYMHTAVSLKMSLAESSQYLRENYGILLVEIKFMNKIKLVRPPQK